MQSADADAQCSLADMYYEGKGVTQDYARAAELYQAAAEQGEAGAQCSLGILYDRGEGVSRD